MSTNDQAQTLQWIQSMNLTVSCSLTNENIPLIPCDDGFMCINTFTDGGKCAPCKLGEFCPKGSLDQYYTLQNYLCKEGYYCSNPLNFTQCPKGYFCPSASIAPIPCTDNGTYCPDGSSRPDICPSGYYCPTAGVKLICPEGFYCKCKFYN